MLNYHDTFVTFQEVPDEISLVIQVGGCPNMCKGCHTPHLMKEGPNKLDRDVLDTLIERHSNVTCITFFGGEQYGKDFVDLVKHIKLVHPSKKVCLYTGAEKVSSSVAAWVDFLKVGPYKRELGGLDNPNTNQKFIDMNAYEVLNYKFQK